MTIAHNGIAQPARMQKSARSRVFDIKSASIDGLGLVLKGTDMAEISADLQSRFDQSSAAGTPVLIDVSALTAQGIAGELDLPLLVSLLRSLALQPVGVVGAKGDLLASALALGMSEEMDIGHLARRDAAPAQDEQPQIQPAQKVQIVQPVSAVPERALSTQNISQAQNDEKIREAVQSAVAKMVHAPLIIDKPVRSGQRIYAKGCDIIVLNAVGHGAEVIADGNIHVYGPLRGRAIAGAFGNSEARIFALSMEPDLYSINGIFSTTDIPLPADVHGKPAQIWLENERLIAKALKS